MCKARKRQYKIIDILLTKWYDKKKKIGVSLEGISLETKEISQAVIGRLPRYLRYLGDIINGDITV